MRTMLRPTLTSMMRQAGRLARGNGLLDATAKIQRALGATGLRRASPGATPAAHTRDPGDRATASPRKTTPDGEASADFTEQTYIGDGGTRAYRLFVPTGFDGKALPLIVMLHGCGQDPEDFARGTRMNEIAQERGLLVLYPAQAPRSNMSKCWNWFRPSDQRRGQGEPALLAGMTRHVIKTQAVDERRVYVAGLSAGGAMAAILAREYPDLFSAVGVHSGLAVGAAHDVSSAFAAMRDGGAAEVAAGAPDPAGGPRDPVPVIVFHGDHDTTVHPRNGEQLISQLLADASGKRPTLLEDKAAGDAAPRASRRRFTRESWPDGRGTTLAEHWVVHGAGHAWSGGSARGSYTDARGPDATREMVRFFLEHPGRVKA